MNNIIDAAYRNNFEKKIKAYKQDSDGTRRFTFDIVALQRFLVFNLQSRIVDATANIRPANAQVQPPVVKHLTAIVYLYCRSLKVDRANMSNIRFVGEAVKDLEYMEQSIREKHGGQEDNLFEMQCSRQLERSLLEHCWPSIRRMTQACDYNDPKLPGIQLSKKRDPKRVPRLKRLLWSIVAALLIIVPVGLMLKVIWHGIHWVAPIGGIAVLILLLVVVPGFQTRDACALTAAYASVLLVFVGANNRIVL